MAEYQTKKSYKGGNTQEKGSNKDAVSASKIGEPFHNPYTFIPFPDDVKRGLPTPLTVDEHPDEKGRLSGILDLEVKTLSPLMTCNPVSVSKKEEDHKTYKSLAIGNDIILPSTGVRGALRTLMTILSGGTLGYMDENLWLTQNRDANLGPSSKFPHVPDKPFLAEVVTPGSETSSGTIKLGETKLIKAVDLMREIGNFDEDRPTDKRKKHRFYTDSSGDIWKVKLSGPFKTSGKKKEGLFKENGEHLELTEEFWKAYQGRYRHSPYFELEEGDLIWLEPVEKDCKKITSASDIKSIQWARWGRQGVAFKDVIPPQMLPDSMRDDGCVDMVTDLFGQIPAQDISAAGPFAARIRPGNLIFLDAIGETVTETLAPLAPPHPGCMAFYRDETDFDLINKNSPLKGYKVYRNTVERGDSAPWKYSVQGVYKEKGALKSSQQRVNKTAELLNEGLTGKLRISFRALNSDELALLYSACSVDWKLGGGKPLGLGRCRITSLKMVDEDGTIRYPMEIDENGGNLKLSQKDLERTQNIKNRINLYRVSQVPVDKLRYPRAVTKNNNKSSRAGLAWFSRHASPKKNGTGLETIWTTGELAKEVGGSQIKAQALPKFNAKDSNADLLYGYDMVELDIDPFNRKKKIVGKMVKFESAFHASSDEKSGINASPSGKSRSINRLRRRDGNINGYPSIQKDNIGSIIAEEIRNEKVTPERAQEFLDKIKEFGITRDQSNKWSKRYKLLENFLNKH